MCSKRRFKNDEVHYLNSADIIRLIRFIIRQTIYTHQRANAMLKSSSSVTMCLKEKKVPFYITK